MLWGTIHTQNVRLSASKWISKLPIVKEKNKFSQMFWLVTFNPFQPGVAIYIETSNLICTAYRMTGF